MNKNSALMLAAVIFMVMGLVHLIRAVLGLDAVIAGFKVPVYVSYIFFLVAGCLAWLMYSAGKK